MKTDRDLLGESAVYPGHPVTVALCIVRHFPSLEVAMGRTQNDSSFLGVSRPNALGDGTIPGAGGNVYLALDLLHVLAKGIVFEEAVAQADKDWAECDSQAKGGYAWDKNPEDHRDHYLKRWQEGQAQADRFKAVFQEEVGKWL